jgi:hypothetical protein
VLVRQASIFLMHLRHLGISVLRNERVLVTGRNLLKFMLWPIGMIRLVQPIRICKALRVVLGQLPTKPTLHLTLGAKHLLLVIGTVRRANEVAWALLLVWDLIIIWKSLLSLSLLCSRNLLSVHAACSSGAWPNAQPNHVWREGNVIRLVQGLIALVLMVWILPVLVVYLWFLGV